MAKQKLELRGTFSTVSSATKFVAASQIKVTEDWNGGIIWKMASDLHAGFKKDLLRSEMRLNRSGLPYGSY
jgi:hypothetical protein